MKKILILISVSFLIANQSIAQNYSFQKGGIYASVGYGLNNTMRGIVITSAAVATLLNSSSSQTVSNITANNVGPVIGRFEFGLGNKFGLGIVLANNNIIIHRELTGLAQTGTDISGNPVYRNKQYDEKFSYNNFSIGLRPTFHFIKSEKWDLSLGIGAGYSFIKIKSIDVAPSTQPFSLKVNLPVYASFTFGVKYYFTPIIGAYAEVGYDKSSLAQVGLAFKL